MARSPPNGKDSRFHKADPTLGENLVLQFLLIGKCSKMALIYSKAQSPHTKIARTNLKEFLGSLDNLITSY
ncbi:hypothetical protein CsatB_023778 [Cannabis sativa]